VAEKRQAVLEGLLIAIIPIVAFAYYSDTLRYWFFYDDAFNIFHSTQSIRVIFLSHDYSYAFYTPLLPLSFKADVFFFKLNPFPYHVHNVLILVLIAFLMYRIMRLYSDRISAFSPVLIVLFSTPSLVCVSWITLRQYLYAVLFALIAVYLHLRKERLTTVSIWHVFAILICCELSFLGKEQFITLPVVLFLISPGCLRKRIHDTYLYFVLLLVHLVLRWYVLGSIGGYLGVTYDPKVYVKAVFASLLTASAVLFGFRWIVFIILAPLLLKPRKSLMVFIIWLASLAVSFLTMSFYPSADTYRYWLIAVVLFSFMISFNAMLLSRGYVKMAYLIIIFLFFFVHTWSANKDVKGFFKKEAGMAKTVSEALLDGKYQDTLFLIPKDRYIVESHYIYSIARDYLNLYNLRTRASFYPFEFLAYYPQIIGDFEKVCEIKGEGISDISDIIRNRITLFKSRLLKDKLEVQLRNQGSAIDIRLGCNAGRQISVFFLREVGFRYFIDTSVMPYLERVEMDRFLKSDDRGDVKVLPVDALSYKMRQWYIGEEPLDSNGLYLTANCTNAMSETTSLSNLLYVQKPGA